MNITELLNIIKDGECDEVEFKRSLTRDSAKDIVAFLNTSGGLVLFGVDDDGTLVGTDESSDPDRILESIEPEPFNLIETDEIMIDKKRIITLKIKKSQRMHMYRKTVYMRIGTMNKPLSVDDILEKASESMLLRFDEMGNHKASLNDLDRELIESYFLKRSQYRNVTPPDEDFNTKLDLIGAVIKTNGDRRPTNGGLLFFCRYPQRFLLQAALRISVFRSRDMLDTTDNRVFEGTLPEIVERASDFINLHIPLESKLESNRFARTIKKAYPLLAIREALINAVTHRNYFDSADVRVFIFPNSIEIINPGGFPPGVTPDNPIHKPRNPLISQYFFDLGYIEKYGMGLRRMVQVCREFGLREPEFVLKEAETKVVFFGPENDDIQNRILATIEMNGQITSREVVRMFGVSRDTANRYLRKLIQEDKIRRTGKGRSVKYIK